MNFHSLYLKVYPKLYYMTHIPIIGNWLNEYKHKIIKQSILNDFSDIITEYKKLDFRLNHQIRSIDKNYPIWIFWWQGLESMPQIVKICYNSILQNANDHPIHLITKDNIIQYTTTSLWNNIIFEWLNNGKIDIAYFSDILRMYLLYTYGGFWIDSTVLLTQPLDNFIQSSTFLYSGRRLHINNNYFASKGKWTSFLIYTQPQNLLIKFIYDLLFEEIYRNGKKRDYFMVDYCFITAYEQLTFVQTIVNEIPPVPNKISILIKILNTPFNEVVFKNLTQSNPFLKTTYKHKWTEKSPKSELTYFGYLQNKYL